MDGKDKMDESTKDEIRRLKRQKEMAEQDYKRDENFTLEQLKAISRKLDNQIMKLEGVEPNGRARGGKAVQKIEKNSGGEGRKKRRLKLNRSNAEYNKIAAEELANKENDSKMGQDSKMPPQPVVKPSKLKSKKSKNNDSPSNEQKAASKVLWITTEKEKEEENIKVQSRGDAGNVLTDTPTMANEFDEEELKLKQQTDTIMRYASMKVCREYLERYNGLAHCELDVIKEELRSLVHSTLLRVPVDERDRNVAQVRDIVLTSFGSMDELLELVRVVPGEKRKYTFKSEETRQSIVANAKRLTQAKHDALRDGNNSFQALHLMCTKSLVKIPDSDGLCNGDVVKFRRNGGFVLTEKRLMSEVGKTMGIIARNVASKLREYKFTLKTEVTDDEGNTKLKTYKGDIRSLSDDTTLYFTHENFNINTTPLELASMTQDKSIRALRREPSTFVFGPSGCNLTADSNGIRPCREEKCTTQRAPGNTNFDCCINCGKEFKKRYTNEKGWEAARRRENLPITVKVSCPNKDKGCDWSCQSNQTRQYATHKGHCNRKMAAR